MGTLIVAQVFSSSKPGAKKQTHTAWFNLVNIKPQHSNTDFSNWNMLHMLELAAISSADTQATYKAI